jgi:NAD(P)-dependent dehydrogenase (short-subunit alcohol dehydrogenase family)
MKYVIVITGASSGVGALTARRLAEAGHTVYATMRETGRRNAKQVEAARKFAAEKNVDLRIAELDVSSQESADRAVRQVLSEAGRSMSSFTMQVTWSSGQRKHSSQNNLLSFMT